MAVLTHTYDLASLRSNRFQSVAEFGTDTINEVLQMDLDAHNQIVDDMMGGLCEPTTDVQDIYGTSAGGEMVEVDENGRGPTQGMATGSTVAFPLRRFQYAVGWNDRWMLMNTPADMAELMLQAQDAHKRRIIRDIQRALYLSGNYTFNDFNSDKRIDLFVKRLLNADGTNIPNGPNGEVFDGATHSHYDATAALTAGNVKAAISDIIEHGLGNDVVVAINRADEDAYRALPGFTEFRDPRLSLGTQANLPTQTLDITRVDNRAIGLLGAATIWVKPWAIAGYPFT